LGVISKGCLEIIKCKLEPVLHMVLGALRDAEQMVRGAASFALCSWNCCNVCRESENGANIT